MSRAGVLCSALSVSSVAVIAILCETTEINCILTVSSSFCSLAKGQLALAGKLETFRVSYC